MWVTGFFFGAIWNTIKYRVAYSLLLESIKCCPMECPLWAHKPSKMLEDTRAMAGRRARVLSKRMGCYSCFPTIATSECDPGFPHQPLFKRKLQLFPRIFHFVNIANEFYFKAFSQPSKINLSWEAPLWPSLKIWEQTLALSTHSSTYFRVIWVVLPKCPPCFDVLQILMSSTLSMTHFIEDKVENRSWSPRAGV